MTVSSLVYDTMDRLYVMAELQLAMWLHNTHIHLLHEKSPYEPIRLYPMHVVGCMVAGIMHKTLENNQLPPFNLANL